MDLLGEDRDQSAILRGCSGLGQAPQEGERRGLHALELDPFALEGLDDTVDVVAPRRRQQHRELVLLGSQHGEVASHLRSGEDPVALGLGSNGQLQLLARGHERNRKGHRPDEQTIEGQVGPPHGASQSLQAGFDRLPQRHGIVQLAARELSGWLRAQHPCGKRLEEGRVERVGATEFEALGSQDEAVTGFGDEGQSH
ncbi:hypothetical protein D3C72_1335500 [compost metagenome]